MIKTFFFFLLITLAASASDISKQSKPATVRVLLAKLAENALIETRGHYLLYNPKSGELITTGLRKKSAKITTGEKGLCWGEEFPGAFEIQIVPSEKNGAILVNGLPYKGSIEVYGIGGTINIVNEVDTENYLSSILGSKVKQKYSPEALDAISITERTNLLYLIQKNLYAGWQVEAEHVGYTGLVAASQNAQVLSSVNRTQNLILQHKKKAFPTSWSEDNAGRTVCYSTIFRKSSSCPEGATNLPSLHQRRKGQWRFNLPLSTLSKVTGLSTITAVNLFQAKKSSKVYAIRFIGPAGKKDMSFADLQAALGKTLLPSNDFQLHLKGKKVYFVGYGKGLGVGLCAKSAEILAQRKASTESILLTHFPESELIHLRQKIVERLNTSQP